METTFDHGIDKISFSLIGISVERIPLLMETVKHACFGREDTLPFAWFFEACLAEIELSQTPEIERGFIRPPCEDWTAVELSDFYRAFHILSYGPIEPDFEKLVDDVVTLSLAAVIDRMQRLERKLECYTR